MKELEALDKLINICVDSQKRYEHAAGDVGRQDLEKFFLQQAKTRMLAAEQLRMERAQFTKDSNGNGTWAGTVDRAAMDFSVVMSMGDTGVVEWCRKDSEEVLREYDQTLAGPLPPKLQEMVKRQRAEAERTIETLEEVLREFGGPRS
jgi:uncharacterized protein (TIGR02284 family)